MNTSAVRSQTSPHRRCDDERHAAHQAVSGCPVMIDGPQGDDEHPLAPLSTREPDILDLTVGPCGPAENFDFAEKALLLQQHEEAVARAQQTREILRSVRIRIRPPPPRLRRTAEAAAPNRRGPPPALPRRDGLHDDAGRRLDRPGAQRPARMRARGREARRRARLADTSTRSRHNDPRSVA